MVHHESQSGKLGSLLSLEKYLVKTATFVIKNESVNITEFLNKNCESKILKFPRCEKAGKFEHRCQEELVSEEMIMFRRLNLK